MSLPHKHKTFSIAYNLPFAHEIASRLVGLEAKLKFLLTLCVLYIYFFYKLSLFRREHIITVVLFTLVIIKSVRGKNYK